MKVAFKMCLEEYTEPVYEALKAEEGQSAPEKGTVRIARDGGCISIIIESVDLSGLRALSNSYLLLAHAAYSSVVSASARVSL